MVNVKKMARPTTLVRQIDLPLLTFYGLSTILGAAIIAGVTALSYCQLVAHFPKSTGEAY